MTTNKYAPPFDQLSEAGNEWLLELAFESYVWQECAVCGEKCELVISDQALAVAELSGEVTAEETIAGAVRYASMSMASHLADEHGALL